VSKCEHKSIFLPLCCCSVFTHSIIFFSLLIAKENDAKNPFPQFLVCSLTLCRAFNVYFCCCFTNWKSSFMWVSLSLILSCPNGEEFLCESRMVKRKYGETGWLRSGRNLKNYLFLFSIVVSDFLNVSVHKYQLRGHFYMVRFTDTYSFTFYIFIT